jgi:protein TonB
LEKEKERFVVVDQVAPPKEQKKTELPKPPESPKMLQRQENFTANIEITPKDFIDPLPTQDLLETSAVSNETTTGTDAPTFQTPVVTETNVGTGTDNGTEAEPKKEVMPDKQPQFPGGIQAWLAFLNNNLRSPEELESGEKRTVVIHFHVAEDGSITNFIVVQSAGSAFDNEVISVLKKMPKWTPAMQAGQPVSVSFTQPVSFVGVEE